MCASIGNPNAADKSVGILSQWSILKYINFKASYLTFWVFEKAKGSLCKSINPSIFFILIHESPCSEYFHDFIFMSCNISQYIFTRSWKRNIKAKKVITIADTFLKVNSLFSEFVLQFHNSLKVFKKLILQFYKIMNEIKTNLNKNSNNSSVIRFILTL